MRDSHVYNFRRALPRMSWHPHNLYNLWRRSLSPKIFETSWSNTPDRLFKQRWASKALLRGYHGDFINEKIFKRWYLPSILSAPAAHSATGEVTAELSKWARKDRVAGREYRKKEEEDAKGLAPLSSLMFAEVERRIDVIIFRACLAHSVYEARRLVIHGDVLLNGKKHQNPNTRLAPGDMVSVDPKAIRFLQPSSRKADADTEPANAEASETEESTSASEVEAEASSENAEDAESDAVANADADADSETKTEGAKWSKPVESPSQRRAREAQKNSNLTPFNLPEFASPFLFIPAYIEASFLTCSAIYLRHPTARPGYSEIPTPWDADGEIMRFAWEWYVKRRSRIRSKTQLARMPENRTRGPSDHLLNAP